MTKPLKIGLVGLDSSHCVEYATLLHDASHAHHVPGGRIVAAMAGGSPDWDLSTSRLAGFRDRMKNEFGVALVASLQEVAAESDAIMILSIDGRAHPAQFEAIAPHGKPVYIDKPMSVSVAEAVRIRNVARETGTRVFSSSVWRHARGLREALAALGGPCRHAHLQGQWPLEPGLHGWFYYGIHQVELLYSAMGTGCRQVACTRHDAVEVLNGYWADGRIGTIAANHAERRPFGGWLLGGEGSALVAVEDSKQDRYAAFLKSALEFFNGAVEPVPLAETVETIAFMEAAAGSARQAGAPVPLRPYQP
jgi:predicted dehydrogenase